eukprot:gnl/TRDRNA2_/TRDRNA2_133225_c0_seq2.p1 gnl/TRDRNA2_/TRDRNA2_133225_c0~~gnl/TRDRNA2_/TRDRNA2_133225_c0_seq2.p1  ORF type:complete len:881 (-),score=155.99 gnl/TRDRNA2_/TRDRNA2_133225_c0_seq2:146-2788(-)
MAETRRSERMLSLPTPNQTGLTRRHSNPRLSRSGSRVKKNADAQALQKALATKLSALQMHISEELDAMNGYVLEHAEWEEVVHRHLHSELERLQLENVKLSAQLGKHELPGGTTDDSDLIAFGRCATDRGPCSSVPDSGVHHSEFARKRASTPHLSHPALCFETGQAVQRPRAASIAGWTASTGGTALAPAERESGDPGSDIGPGETLSESPKEEEVAMKSLAPQQAETQRPLKQGEPEAVLAVSVDIDRDGVESGRHSSVTDTDGTPDEESAEDDGEASAFGANKSEDDHIYVVHQIWTEKGCSKRGSKPSKRQTSSTLSKLPTAQTELCPAEENTPKSPSRVTRVCQYLYVQPNTKKRVAWDLWGLLFILLDVVFIPLQFFEVEESSGTITLNWLTRLFWTLDMPGSFLTGFIYKDGTMEMRPFLIAKRYAKTWLPLDFIVVSSDWMEALMAVGGDATAARLGRAARVGRILRMMRLLRLTRMPELFKGVGEFVNTEKLSLMLEILKIMALFIGVAHMIACFWYGIGRSTSVAGRSNWVEQHGFGRSSIEYKYATSLHWSLTQFIGSMDVQPHNWLERLFAVLVLICAFMMSAAFISSITSTMTRLHIVSSRQTSQIAVLRRYMRQNGISQQLMTRIQRNAQYAMEEQQRNTPEAEVELLPLVSEPLRTELHFELYAPMLTEHPLFAHFEQENPAGLRKVCHLGMSTKALSGGDTLFTEGEAPELLQMFFLCRGKGQYTTSGGSEFTVVPRNFMCEPTIWASHWIHQGTFHATTESKFLILDVNVFQETFAKSVDSLHEVRRYAEEFILFLNEAAVATDITDKNICGEIMGKLLCSEATPDSESMQHMYSYGRFSMRHSKSRSFIQRTGFTDIQGFSA